MARVRGLPSSSQYHGRRSHEIFDIFEQEFAKYGFDAVPKVHQVLASQ
jgi:hypothetical protein